MRIENGIKTKNEIFHSILGGARSGLTFLLMISFLFMFFLIVCNGFAEENLETLQGPAPEVDAVEMEDEAQPSAEGEEEPRLIPNHPPMDQIPPIPMAEPPDETSFLPFLDSSTAVFYNASTDESIVCPLEGPAAASYELKTGGGYKGADGGNGSELLPATFADMGKISVTDGFPWRMNTKLVMRFEDSGGTSHWAVASGSMRDARAVLTAGHCVYDNNHNYGWAKEIWIYPGYDGNDWSVPPDWAVNAYGWGHGTYFGSLTGWTSSADWDYDLGIIGIDRAVGMLTGWFAWAYGGSCALHTSQTYHNASYPAEDCPLSGLHNGLDMYYWYGNFDACPGNQLELWTGGGHCFDTVWGGMSGSGAYYIDGSRYVHAVCSTSNRNDIGRYCRQTESWVNFCNNTFIPNTRGSTFDLQPLDVNAEPATIEAGSQTTLLNHLAANPTNNDPSSDNYSFRVYLSTNDNISASDQWLSTQNYNWDFAAMSSVRVNMLQVTIPVDTAPGDYWLGLVYDSGTDGNSANNDTDGWDAVPISVVDTTPPTPNPMTFSSLPYEISTSSISMVASEATDPRSPVCYFFDFYSSPTGGSGGTNSTCQPGRTYTDLGLSTNHKYGYRVRARDAIGNYTGYSAVSYDYTDIETPVDIDFGIITSTSISARSLNTPSGLTRGISGLYLFNATNSNNSGWHQNNNYWIDSELSPNSEYCYRARARNGDGSLTGWSPTACKTTLANLPAQAGFSGVTYTSIQANWTANGNPAGTEYYCENETQGTNSGWTTNTYWDSAGLSAATSYTFRVKARNGDGIETAWTSLGAQSTHAPGVQYVATDGFCDGNGPCHTTIQAACNAAADGDVIMATQETFTESVVSVSNAITYIFQGGYNASYSSMIGVTSLNGTLELPAGNFEVENLSIE